jgi:hypothetical protein
MRTKRMLSIVNSMRGTILNAPNPNADKLTHAMILLQKDLISELEKEIAGIKLSHRYNKKIKKAG